MSRPNIEYRLPPLFWIPFSLEIFHYLLGPLPESTCQWIFQRYTSKEISVYSINFNLLPIWLSYSSWIFPKLADTLQEQQSSLLYMLSSPGLILPLKSKLLLPAQKSNRTLLWSFKRKSKSFLGHPNNQIYWQKSRCTCQDLLGLLVPCTLFF